MRILSVAYWCGDIDCEDVVGGGIGAGILTVRMLSVAYWCGDIDCEDIVGGCIGAGILTVRILSVGVLVRGY